jgi:3-phenylpropionate/trans-cinnamate dioxygenase ferredoxin subunit
MAGFVRVAGTDEIPVGTMRGFVIGYDRILVCHTAKGFFALTDECSHDSAPISDGELLDNQVICPRHGARFEVTTGAVLGPPAVVGIEPIALKIENGEIHVQVG